MMVGLVAGLIACGEPEPVEYVPAPTRVRTTAVDTPAQRDAPPPAFDDDPHYYFTGPWPDDRRKDPDGFVNVTDFPNPRNGGGFATMLRTTSQVVKGWGLSTPIYLPFTGAIDIDTLPATPEDSRKEDASVYLVALDSASPVRGQRVPLEWQYVEEETLFLPSNTLAVRPVVGFPLEPKTKYALVVTTSVRDADGQPLGPEEGLFRALWHDEAGAAERAHYGPLGAWLDGAGIDRRTVAGATIFTTQALLDELLAVRDHLLEQGRPVAKDLRHLTSDSNGWVDWYIRNGPFHVFEATYDAPYYLYGQAPYQLSGGEMRFDDAGRPVPSKTEQMRVAICIPKTAPPPGGFPMVYVSHGTGGDYKTMIEDDTCSLLANIGVAAVGIDQMLHGPRSPPNSSCLGQGPETCFLNVLNAPAGRNVIRHSAIDHLSLRRMVEGLTIPASVHPDEHTVTFDLTHPGYFGHSQGALTGAVYLAIEPELRGALLSGGGGHLTTTLLTRDEGLFKTLLEGVLGLNISGHEELHQFHPALALMQTFADVTDPLSYGRYWHRKPVSGRKSVFKTSGLLDDATPYQTAIALAVAGALPQMIGGHTDSHEFALAGLTPRLAPVKGNIAASDGQPAVTAIFRQFPNGDHFPIFYDQSARAQMREFFSTLSIDGVPSVPAP